MSEAWNDLFVRTDVRETGPDVRYGGFGSPDIIPSGTSPGYPPNFITEESYRQYYNNSLYENKPNYLYVRARNSSTSATKAGNAFLVMTDPAVVLWPGGDGWTRIKTGSGNYHSALGNVAPGKIGVTEDPFVLIPEENGHRCVVTWLSTADHPVDKPPQQITSSDELVKFLIKNPNYAHKNIDIAPDTTGVVTFSKPFDSGTKAGKWRFGMSVSGCSGFEVSFRSGIEVPGKGFIEMLPKQVNQDITYFIDAIDLPANYQTNFFCTYDQKNLSPAKFSVVFVAFSESDPAHALHVHSIPYARLGATGEAASASGFPLGSIGVMRGSAKG